MTHNRVSRRNLLKTGTAAGLIGVAGCLGGDEQTDLSIAVVEGAAATELISSLQRVVSNESDEVRIVVEQTPGVPANLRLYNDGDVDALAMTNYGAIQAQDSEGPFEERPVENLPYQGIGIAQYHMHWIALTDSDIQTTDDLPGRDVFPLPPGWSFRQMIEELHEVEGTWSDIEPNVANLAPGDVADAFSEGRIEAALAYTTNLSGVPGFYSEVDARIDMEFVEASESWTQAAQNYERADYVEADLQALYEQDMGGLNTVPSIAAGLQLAFGDDVDDDVTYEIARISHEHVDDIKEGQSNYPDHSNLDMMTNMYLPTEYQLPIHGGVADLLEENNHWDDSWERA
jgi:TRAP-type uncharacterized transport system substrate-binding protein